MKLYIAGVEGSDMARTVASDAVGNGFASYYYLRNQSAGPARLRPHLKSLVVDSGAHTFFAQDPSIGSATMQVRKAKHDDAEAYMDAYLSWLVRQSKHFDYFVELDIGEVVGQSLVYVWRKRLVDAGLARKAIICYHPKVEAWADFLKVAREWPSRYVALEGLRRGRAILNYGACVKDLYDAQVRVHGFAMVKRKWLDRVPFYSVDSSSVLAAVQFGAHFTHAGADKFTYVRFSRLKSAASRTRAQRALVRGDVSPEEAGLRTLGMGPKRRHDIVLRMIRQAVRSMQDMEDYYTRLWEARGIRWTEPKARRSKSSKSAA